MWQEKESSSWIEGECEYLMTSGPWRIGLLKKRGGVNVGDEEVGTSRARDAAMRIGTDSAV